MLKLSHKEELVRSHIVCPTQSAKAELRHALVSPPSVESLERKRTPRKIVTISGTIVCKKGASDRPEGVKGFIPDEFGLR